MRKSIESTQLDLKKIGERIKELRKSYGKDVTQTLFAGLLGYRDAENVKGTVSQWEKGKDLPTLDKLVRMSELCDVSVDYILCKTNYRHIGNEQISEVTGLSDASIEVLRRNKNTGDNRYLFMLDLLLSDEETFSALMESLLSIVYPFCYLIPRDNTPSSFVYDENYLQITPDIMKQLSDSLPDNLFRKMRTVIENFAEKKKDIPCIAPNEYHVDVSVDMGDDEEEEV